MRFSASRRADQRQQPGSSISPRSADPRPADEEGSEVAYRPEQMPAFLRAWQRELDEHYGRGGTTDARRRLRARLRDAGWSDEAVDALQEYLDWTSQHQDGVISKRAVEQPDPKSVIRGDVARYLLPNRRIMSREDEVGSTSAGTSASERMAGYNPSPKTAATTQDALRRIRRRLRAYLWRQWQNGANRFKELRQRGLPKFHAAVAAGSPTGFWRMSRHPAVQQALRNPYFHGLGLPRLYVPAQA